MDEIIEDIELIRQNATNNSVKKKITSMLPIFQSSDIKYINKIKFFNNVSINEKVTGYTLELKISGGELPAISFIEQMEELEGGISVYSLNSKIPDFKKKISELHDELIKDSTFVDFGVTDVNDYIKTMNKMLEENKEDYNFENNKEKMEFIIQHSMLSTFSGGDDNFIGIFKDEKKNPQYFLMIKTTNEIRSKILKKKIFDDPTLTINQVHHEFIELRKISQMNRDILAYSVCEKIGIIDKLKTSLHDFIDDTTHLGLVPVFTNMYNCLMKKGNIYTFYNNVLYTNEEGTNTKSKGGIIYRTSNTTFEIFFKNAKYDPVQKNIMKSNIPKTKSNLNNAFPMHVPYIKCNETSHMQLIKKNKSDCNLMKIKGKYSVSHIHDNDLFYDYYDEDDIEIINEFFIDDKFSISLTCCGMLCNSHDLKTGKLLSKYYDYINETYSDEDSPSLSNIDSKKFQFCKLKYKNLLDNLHQFSEKIIDDPNNNINNLNACYDIKNQMVVVPKNILCAMLWPYNDAISQYQTSASFFYPDVLQDFVGNDYQSYSNTFSLNYM